MDFETLRVKTVAKEEQSIDDRRELHDSYRRMIMEFKEVFNLLGPTELGPTEINLGYIPSTLHSPDAMVIAEITARNNAGQTIDRDEANQADSFVITYSSRAQSSEFRFPVVQEAFGLSRRLIGSKRWNNWQVVEAERVLSPMLEEAPKTLAMLIEAAQDPVLNDPELAGRVRQHYEKGWNSVTY